MALEPRKNDDPCYCKWCRYKLEQCICYSPEWKFARKRFQLTERECTILHEFSRCDGTSKHVARALGISTKTVEIFVAGIKKKMQCSTRIQAILNWDRAIQEYKFTMADQVKPIHPHDIFEFPDGEWYYRADLGHNIPNDAMLWPYQCPHWHLLTRGKAHGSKQGPKIQA